MGECHGVLLLHVLKKNKEDMREEKSVWKEHTFQGTYIKKTVNCKNNNDLNKLTPDLLPTYIPPH